MVGGLFGGGGDRGVNGLTTVASAAAGVAVAVAVVAAVPSAKLPVTEA